LKSINFVDKVETKCGKLSSAQGKTY